MIIKVIDKLLRRRSKNAAPSNAPDQSQAAAAVQHGVRKEYAAHEHGIQLAHVDKRAIEVCNTLQEQGYEAYIVGGAVRDLMLGLQPKDFDVATDATPEQVKALFRRAFIIGRRFRIVHVIFGRGREHEIIEVTTFRANVDHAQAAQVDGNERQSKQRLEGVQHAVDHTGRVLRDNVWGQQDEDAARRDFTINALYYDPYAQIVVDYHGGTTDVKNRCIRMIGDPATRYREDPVRILRAVRFAAKLKQSGFTIDAATAQPLVKMKRLLADVPPSRMFDEMLKIFQTGHGIASVAQLRELGLDQGVYPLMDLVVARAENPLLQQALLDTDARVALGKPVAPSFFLACVLWPDIATAWTAKKGQATPITALHEAIDEVFDQRVGDISGRGKLGADMREIWVLQTRFERRTGKTAHSLVEHLRFRAAWDFLHLRSLTGEVAAELAQWWEAFSLADPEQRRAMQETLPSPSHKKSSKNNGKSDMDGENGAEIGTESRTDPAQQPLKRRRRRSGPRRRNAPPSSPAAGGAT